MSALAVVGVVGFLAMAGLFGYVALRGRSGTLPKDSAFGLKNREVEASPEAWVAGHRAAWPILAAGAVVALFHAAGCLIAGFMGAQGASFLGVLVVAGILVCVALWFVASAAGVAAATRLDR